MENFSPALLHVKEHLDQCLPEEDILKACDDVGHTFRKRKLGPAQNVCLLLLQLLANVALRGLRRVADVTVSAQAICAARMRLPIRLFHRLIERSLPDGACAAGFRGLKTYIVDGLSFMTADTLPLAKKFGKPRNQRGPTQGNPAPKLLTLLEAGGGFIVKAILLPWRRQEFTCLSRLFKAMKAGSLLVGDRGLVSFTHLFLLFQQGFHGCFRLPKGQVVFKRGRKSRRLVRRQGKQDLRVRWSASTRPKWLSEKRWALICGQTIELRQISFRICRKGFKTHWAWIITTLLDPQLYPAQELVELYGRRWQIEVDFRDLKQTLKMKMISARTVEGVQKEVLAFILLYNLIRRVMGQAARQQKVDPDRISFADAKCWLLYSQPGAALPELVVNPIRTRKSPPRQVKNARHRFSQLKQPRSQLCKPPYVVKL